MIVLYFFSEIKVFLFLHLSLPTHLKVASSNDCPSGQTLQVRQDVYTSEGQVPYDCKQDNLSTPQFI